MSKIKKRKITWTDEAYQSHEKIEVPILYHIDEETGKKVYDLEEMTNEFENRLSELTGVTVMCSIEED
tara:strand:- start:859 stop:1062 length:204 start_codon:yes stop_codon:yes gene_type:complete